jgi:DNA adenine methylase
MHDLLTQTPPDALTDIQRAARFFYLQKNSFGGLVVGQHFHYSVIARPNFRPERIPELLERTHKRLEGVQIECLPYEEVLARYDRPTTLFYLDPPYWGRSLYKFNFRAEDFVSLEQRLGEIKGKFLLSLNDSGEIRKLFDKFRISAVALAYTAQKRTGKRYSELIIRNF